MKLQHEKGQALLETILLGLLLLLPIVWLLGVLGSMQRAALATSSAARAAAVDAGRDAIDEAEARKSIERAVSTALIDQSLDPDLVRIRMAATAGFTRGGSVRVQVSYPVRVAALPWLGAITGPVIWVRSEGFSLIEPYRSR